MTAERLALEAQQDPLERAIEAFKAESLVDKIGPKAERLVEIATCEKYDAHSMLKAVALGLSGLDSTKRAYREGARIVIERFDQYITREGLILKTIMDTDADKDLEPAQVDEFLSLTRAVGLQLRAYRTQNKKGLTQNVADFMNRLATQMEDWNGKFNDMVTFSAYVKEPENKVFKSIGALYTKMISTSDNGTDVDGTVKGLEVPDHVLALAKEASGRSTESIPNLYTAVFGRANMPLSQRSPGYSIRILEGISDEAQFTHVALTLMSGVLDRGNYLWLKVFRSLLFSHSDDSTPTPFKNPEFVAKVAKFQSKLTQNILIPGLMSGNPDQQTDQLFARMLASGESLFATSLAACIYTNALIAPIRLGRLTQIKSIGQAGGLNPLVANIVSSSSELDYNDELSSETTTIYEQEMIALLAKKWPQIKENLTARFAGVENFRLFIKVMEDFCMKDPKTRLIELAVAAFDEGLGEGEREKLTQRKTEIRQSTNTFIREVIRNIALRDDLEPRTLNFNENAVYAQKAGIARMIVFPDRGRSDQFHLSLTHKDTSGVTFSVVINSDGTIDKIHPDFSGEHEGLGEYLTQLAVTELYGYLVGEQLIPAQNKTGDFFLEQVTTGPITDISSLNLAGGEVRDYIGEARAKNAIVVIPPVVLQEKRVTVRIERIDAAISDKLLDLMFGD